MYAFCEKLAALGSDAKLRAEVYADYAGVYGGDAVDEANFERSVRSPEFGAALGRIFDARPTELFRRVEFVCMTPVKQLRVVDRPIEHVCAFASANGGHGGVSAPEVPVLTSQITALELDLIQSNVAMRHASNQLVRTTAELEAARAELAKSRQNEAETMAAGTVAWNDARDVRAEAAALKAKLATAEAGLDRTRAELATAEAGLAQARVEAERKTAETEAETDTRAALEEELRWARVSYESAELRYQTAVDQAAESNDKLAVLEGCAERLAELEGWVDNLVAMTHGDGLMTPLDVVSEIKRYVKSRPQSPVDFLDDKTLMQLCQKGPTGADSPIPFLDLKNADYERFIERTNGKTGKRLAKPLPGTGKPRTPSRPAGTPTPAVAEAR